MPPIMFVHGRIGSFADEHALSRLRPAERAVGWSRLHLVTHSAGAVIAASSAGRFPDRVACLMHAGGNLTPPDALWSPQLAAEVPELTAADRRVPARWLRDAGVEVSEERVRAAVQAVAFQPSTALRAVVDDIGEPAYERLLKAAFTRTPVRLVAGACSRAWWDVPGRALWAASSTEIPYAGEAPEVFGETLAALRGREE